MLNSVGLEPRGRCFYAHTCGSGKKRRWNELQTRLLTAEYVIWPRLGLASAFVPYRSYLVLGSHGTTGTVTLRSTSGIFWPIVTEFHRKILRPKGSPHALFRKFLMHAVAPQCDLFVCDVIFAYWQIKVTDWLIDWLIVLQIAAIRRLAALQPFWHKNVFSLTVNARCVKIWTLYHSQNRLENGKSQILQLLQLFETTHYF